MTASAPPPATPKRLLSPGRLIAAGLVAAILGGAVWWRISAAPLSFEQLKARQTLANSTFPILGGVPIHVVDEGRGPAVVMLHGHLNSLRIWDRWAAALVRRGYRVVRFDMAPYGLSGPSPDRRYGIVKTYEMLAELVRQKELGKVLLVTTANGGPPAAWFAHNRPDSVAGLVLVNTPFLAPKAGLSPRFDTERWLRDNIFDPLGQPRPISAAYTRKLIGEGADSAPEDFIDHIHDLGRRTDVTDALKLYGSSFSFSTPAYNNRNLSNAQMLGQLSTPILIQWGGRSILAVEEGQRLAGLARSAPVSFKIYPAGGHWLPMGAQEKPLGDLLQFFAAVNRRPT